MGETGRTRLVAVAATFVLLAGCTAVGSSGPQPSGVGSGEESGAASIALTPTPFAALTPTPASPATLAPKQAPPPTLGLEPLGRTEQARVVRVVDGDTIVVDRGLGNEKLRYIGMDSPETVAPGSPVQWMGPEASAANKALVDGKTVVLEKDVSETDQYGRLLRYVWLHAAGSWTLVNLELVERGFAQVSTWPPDVRYASLFVEATERAREAGVGLWAATPPPAATDPTAGPTPLPLVQASAAADCDPAYPGVCIPPPPPDLDCRDVTFRRFKVLPPDPHHFDGDHDGIGCESG